MPTQADPSGVETIGMPDLTGPCQLVIVGPAAALIAVSLVMALVSPSQRGTISNELPTAAAVPVGADADPAERAIAGRTLAAWRELMNTLDHDDPERFRHSPGLVEIVQTPGLPWFTRRQAALTLGRWGEPAAVSVFQDLLDATSHDPDEAPSLWALKGLSLLGPVASSAGPQVGQIVVDPQRPAHHRLTAIECLSQIGSAYPSGIISLMQTAQLNARDRESMQLRRAALEAIGLYRGGAGAAVPVLIQALDDADADIRREAAFSLGRQGSSAEIAQSSLFDKMVSDPDSAVRDVAGVSLAQTGSDTIPALLSLLDQEDAELRMRGAVVLGKLGRVARSAATRLEEHWDDPEATVRLATLEASWRVTASGDAVAERIARELPDEDRHIRRQAYLLLVALGPAASGARPILEEHLRHPRAEVRAAARKLLQR